MNKTDTDTETSAATRVFGITELVERTLVNLPAHKIFVFQQVNRKFHKIVQDPIFLQQAFCFDNAVTAALHTHEAAINPLVNDVVSYALNDKTGKRLEKVASWRSMQLFMPPALEIALSGQWTTRPSFTSPTMGYLGYGATLGDFADRLVGRFKGKPMKELEIYAILLYGARKVRMACSDDGTDWKTVRHCEGLNGHSFAECDI